MEILNFILNVLILGIVLYNTYTISKVKIKEVEIKHEEENKEYNLEWIPDNKAFIIKQKSGYWKNILNELPTWRLP